MKNLKKQKICFNKKYSILLILSLLLFITSCTYSEYLSMDYELNRNESWNNEHTEIAFIASKRAYRRPTGMTRFPDGGTSKYLIEEVALYVLNPEKKQLTEIINFNDLVDVIGTSRHRWHINLAFTDTFIYYNIKCKYYIDWARTEEDSLFRCSMKEKYNKSYSVNIYNKKVVEIDSSLLSPIFLENSRTNWIKYSKVDSMLTNIPAADWGLIVQNIWPKSDKDYIEETIYLLDGGSEGSRLTRQAVTEQIISKLNKKEIEKLLKKMERNYNKLKENDPSGYISKEKVVYKRIQELL